MKPHRLADALRSGGYTTQARGLEASWRAFGVPLRRPGLPALIIVESEAGDMLLAKDAKTGKVVATEDGCAVNCTRAVMRAEASEARRVRTVRMRDDLYDRLKAAGEGSASRAIVAACEAWLARVEG